MYQGLIHLHSLLRWIIIILLIWNILRHFSAGKNPFNATDKKLALYLMISAHTTLVIGLYQWFTGSFGLEIIKAVGMGTAMKDSALRFWAVEHITGMLIAIVLITLAKGVTRKNLSDEKKHTRMAIMFLLALIIILASVPWPFRSGGMSRPWFPGM